MVYSAWHSVGAAGLRQRYRISHRVWRAGEVIGEAVGSVCVTCSAGLRTSHAMVDTHSHGWWLIASGSCAPDWSCGSAGNPQRRVGDTAKECRVAARPSPPPSALRPPRRLA
jgi:hypothetical protein